MWQDECLVTEYDMEKIENTFGVGAMCREKMEFRNDEELRECLSKVAGKKFMFVGGGANILFVGDYDGIVLHSKIKGIETTEDKEGTTLAVVGSGETWDGFVAEMVKRGLWGVENLSYIPGEVGGAAVQNIGAYGDEFSNAAEWVEAISIKDGTLRRFDISELGYGYRWSEFKGKYKDQYVIVRVCFRLRRDGKPNLTYKPLAEAFADTENVRLTDIRTELEKIRWGKLPRPEEVGSAGSFFKNPVVGREVYESLAERYPDMPHFEVERGVKIPAGWLIERCGLKGYRHGTAGVWDRQALVMVNYDLGGRRAYEDVEYVYRHVIETVRKEMRIELEPEAIIIR